MAFFFDTSVLIRLTNTGDTDHLVAVGAALELHRRGKSVYVTGQNFVEFWNVATRPLGVNGLGLSVAETDSRLAVFEASFTLLEETPAVYPTWRSLVRDLGVVGKQVHDARLVAVCHVHGITDIVTFNTGHFARLASFWPGIRVIDPANI